MCMHPRRYVFGIFTISALHEIVSTIMDYQMQRTAWMEAQGSPHAENELAAFNGYFGQASALLSFSFSTFGTSFVIRRLGLRRTLVLFPMALMGAVVVVFLVQSRWTIFAAMVIIKGLSYALNNPAKEMLYPDPDPDPDPDAGTRSTTLRRRCSTSPPPTRSSTSPSRGSTARATGSPRRWALP